MTGVDLYLLEQENLELEKQILPDSILDSGELDRFQQMTSSTRKNEFLIGRYLIKSILKTYYNIEKPQIYTDSNGCIHLDNFYISLSHSKNHFSLALSRALRIGVDLERATSKKHYKEIAKKYFSQLEKLYIEEPREEVEKFARFRSLWCLKESFVKSQGGLINEDVINIHFNLKENKVESSPVDETLTFIYETNGYLGLCIRGDLPESEFFPYQVSFNSELRPVRRLSISRTHEIESFSFRRMLFF